MTPLQKAQYEFVDLFVMDVEQFPFAYKATICAQPSLWGMRAVAGLDEPEVRGMIRNLKAERAKVAKSGKTM